MVISSHSTAYASSRPRVPRAPWPLASYLLTALLAVLGWVCLFVLNRTSVRRARTVSLRPNTLFVANHQSTIDTLLIGLVTCPPRCWLSPRLLPWSLAASEVYFATPVRAWFASQLRCIPVAADRRDGRALRRLLRVLPAGVAIHFVEGRRSRSGALGEPAPGAGWLALTSGAQVVPVAIDGMSDVVPFERFGLRCFRRIAVAVGPALDLSPYRGRPPREAAHEVTGLILAAIERQLEIARSARGSSAS